MFLFIVLCLFTISFFLNCWFVFVSIKKLSQKNKVLSERNWFLTGQTRDCERSLEIERNLNRSYSKDVEILRKELAERNSEIKKLKDQKNKR